MADRFPHCRLHRAAIVTHFPTGCPLALDGAAAAQRLLELQNASHQGEAADPHPSVAMGRFLDICNSCAGRLRNDPHVRFLRTKIGGADAA